MSLRWNNERFLNWCQLVHVSCNIGPTHTKNTENLLFAMFLWSHCIYKLKAKHPQLTNHRNIVVSHNCYILIDEFRARWIPIIFNTCFSWLLRCGRNPEGKKLWLLKERRNSVTELHIVWPLWPLLAIFYASQLLANRR